jgi:3-oxoacyl-[acyl-carrier protein] reductase
MTAPMVVLVSGGSRGLGGALVVDLLQRGHSVAAFSRSTSPLIEGLLAGEHKERLFWQEVDGGDPEPLQRFVLAAARRFGRIDALVNNAAYGLEGLLSFTRPGEIHKALAVNLEGVILLSRACIKVMLTHKSGSIINISSVNGLRGHSGVAVYSATKAALDGMSRSLAKELGPSNIRVNSVAPGYFESEMTTGLTAEQRGRILRRTPLGRLASISDILGSIRFLLSAESSFITGQTLVVDGGLTC